MGRYLRMKTGLVFDMNLLNCSIKAGLHSSIFLISASENVSEPSADCLLLTSMCKNRFDIDLGDCMTAT